MHLTLVLCATSATSSPFYELCCLVGVCPDEIFTMTAACCIREPPNMLPDGTSSWASKTYNSKNIPTRLDASHSYRESNLLVQKAFHSETFADASLSSSSFSTSSSFKPIGDCSGEIPQDESMGASEFSRPPTPQVMSAVASVAWNVSADVIPANESES